MGSEWYTEELHSVPTCNNKKLKIIQISSHRKMDKLWCSSDDKLYSIAQVITTYKEMNESHKHNIEERCQTVPIIWLHLNYLQKYAKLINVVKRIMINLGLVTGRNTKKAMKMLVILWPYLEAASLNVFTL